MSNENKTMDITRVDEYKIMLDLQRKFNNLISNLPIHNDIVCTSDFVTVDFNAIGRIVDHLRSEIVINRLLCKSYSFTIMVYGNNSFKIVLDYHST